MNESAFCPAGFKILKKLGRGGTAEVYLAEDKKSGRETALKVPLYQRAELDEFRSIINREYQIIGNLPYPGLLRVNRVISYDAQTPALDLEFCPGKTLDELNEVNSIPALMSIISSISINLYYLKLAGISHGDLKPHNIFLTSPADEYSDGRLHYTKISDLSLALKSDEPKSSRLGVGTIGYMAPETIENEILNHRSDIFAMGIIAYLLATGQHPFMDKDSDPVRTNSRVKEHDPPEPDKINSNIPDELSKLIMSMLEKEPDKRPRDGYEICEKLSQLDCNFPYQKAIRPKHLINALQIEDAAQLRNHNILVCKEDCNEKLVDYSGENLCDLRHLLEINFTAGYLGWNSWKLRFRCDIDDLIYPRRMRKETCRQFHQLSYSKKKKIILTSIAGSRDNARAIKLIDYENPDDYITRPLMHYVKKNISDNTFKRFSRILADRAKETYYNNYVAASMYIQAGEIDKGYTVTLDAATELINENRLNDAVSLLEKFAELCRNHNDFEKLSIILMKTGDTQKLLGEATEAEKTYLTLINLYENHPHDKLLAETYKDLGDLYKMKNDFDAGIKALKKAKRLYRELNDELELSHTLNNIGNILTLDSKFKQALHNYRKALAIQRRLNALEDMASTLNNIAAIFYYRTRLGRSHKILTIALKIQREVASAGEIARSLNNIAYINYEMGNFDEGIDLLDESLSLNRKIGNKKELLFNLHNFSTILYSAGHLEESLKYLNEGRELALELEDPAHTASSYYIAALVKKRLGQYGQAEKDFLKSIDILTEINNQSELISNKFDIARFYIELDDMASAGKFRNDIEEIYKRTGEKKALMNVHRLNARLEKNPEYYRKAIEIAETAKAERDKQLIQLSLMRVSIEEGQFDDAGQLLDELCEIFSAGRSDIENAFFAYLNGRYHSLLNNTDKAEEFYMRGLEIAGKYGMLPEIIDISIGLGQLYKNLKEYEMGFKYYKTAVRSLKKVASDIGNVSLKEKYLKSQKITGLMRAINELKKIMA